MTSRHLADARAELPEPGPSRAELAIEALPDLVPLPPVDDEWVDALLERAATRRAVPARHDGSAGTGRRVAPAVEGDG